MQAGDIHMHMLHPGIVSYKGRCSTARLEGAMCDTTGLAGAALGRVARDMPRWVDMPRYGVGHAYRKHKERYALLHNVNISNFK